jgi:DNA helicase-2/ATP-dependent DNA helicase PcrA
VLILAGAGTGKTKVLTHRMVKIIRDGLASPHEILAVTFTNKAAKEMQERVVALIPASGITIGTFHSVAAKILRRHAEFCNLTSSFSIIDADDQVKIIKSLLVESNIDTAVYKPQNIASIISKWKDVGLIPSKVYQTEMKSQAHKIAKNIYELYQAKLIASNVVDFGDLLLCNTEIFTTHPEILSIYQEHYRYILVDEYQDTNAVQYLWTKMLSAKRSNICCVGDDDQSIYSWRGAEIANILKFEHDFKNAKIIKLERNYRSTTPILHTASLLIKYNKHRHGKELWTDCNDGAPVRVVYCWNDKEEARFVVEEIKTKISNVTAPNDVAILVRAGFQTRPFEEALIAHSVPYRIIGGLKFYERKEVRDILSYIRIIANPNDDIALERIINVPKRSVGDATIESIKSVAKDRNLSIMNAIVQMIDSNIFKPKIHDTLSLFVRNLQSWRVLYSTNTTLNATKQMLEESGYLTMLKEDKTEESRARIENLYEMQRAIADFDKIEDFLEHASLVADGDLSGNIDNAVNLMTMHASKGLEFDVVFLPGWEEGLFPHQKSIAEDGFSGVEEERRLAYVGITRAKKDLYITYAESRRIFNEYVKSDPSRFIAEIDSNMVRKISSQQNYNKGFIASSNLSLSKTTYNSRTIEVITTSNFVWKVGAHVLHSSFGKGVIIRLKDDNIEVAFGQYGVKTIKQAYLTVM